jgi:hypothetical protein
MTTVCISIARPPLALSFNYLIPGIWTTQPQ